MDIKVKALQSFVHGRLNMAKGAEQLVPEAIAKDLIKADLVVAASPDVTALKGAATEKPAGEKGQSGSRKKTVQGNNKDSSSKVPAGGDKGGAEGGTEGGDKGGAEGGTAGGDKGGAEGGTEGGDKGGAEGGTEGGDKGGAEGGKSHDQSEEQ